MNVYTLKQQDNSKIRLKCGQHDHKEHDYSDMSSQLFRIIYNRPSGERLLQAVKKTNKRTFEQSQGVTDEGTGYLHKH